MEAVCCSFEGRTCHLYLGDHTCCFREAETKEHTNANTNRLTNKYDVGVCLTSYYLCIRLVGYEIPVVCNSHFKSPGVRLWD